MFVGYSPIEGGYRFFDPKTGRLSVSSRVVNDSCSQVSNQANDRKKEAHIQEKIQEHQPVQVEELPTS